jgi:hypothetical protein
VPTTMSDAAFENTGLRQAPLAKLPRTGSDCQKFGLSLTTVMPVLPLN